MWLVHSKVYIVTKCILFWTFWLENEMKWKPTLCSGDLDVVRIFVYFSVWAIYSKWSGWCPYSQGFAQSKARLKMMKTRTLGRLYYMCMLTFTFQHSTTIYEVNCNIFFKRCNKMPRELCVWLILIFKIFRVPFHEV